MRERDRLAWQADNLVPTKRTTRVAVPLAVVTVHVTETHDGEACDCIEKDMTLGVGDEVELTHTCHDGRVDKVVATVTSIHLPVEHGEAKRREPVDTEYEQA